MLLHVVVPIDTVSLPKTTNELREMANDFNTPTLLGDTGKYKQLTRGKRWEGAALCEPQITLNISINKPPGDSTHAGVALYSN